MSSQCIEEALAEQELGFEVFALGKGSKEPITTHGKDDATPDPQKARAQLKLRAAGNYGMIWPNHGTAPLVVIFDVDDGKEGPGDGPTWEQRLRDQIAKHGPLPATKQTKTPHGGRHLFFYWPTAVPVPTGDEALGWTMRYPGKHYVVGPGSVIDGKAYVSNGQPILELPRAWVEAIVAEQAKLKDDEPLIRVGGGWYQPPERIGKGHRYSTVRDYAASRHVMGLSKPEVWHLVKAEVAPRFAAPKDEATLREDFERAYKGLTEKYEQKLPPPPPAVAGWRTLADIDDTPPQPLLLGLLEPDGPTLMYAAGGTGKGTTGAWVVKKAQEAGRRVLIFDAERREREWSRRVSGLGGDRAAVVYMRPEDMGSKAGRPLWEGVPILRGILAETGCDLLIVDSILPAVNMGEERMRSDPQVPYQYVQGLDSLGIPVLSFGHTPKGNPTGDPFGSFAWVAAMRLTWLGQLGQGEGHRVRWRSRKKNERGRLPGLLLTFAYDDAGRLCSAEAADDDETTREWLLVALVNQTRSVSDLAEEWHADDDEPPSEAEMKATKATLGKTLYRLSQEGTVERVGDKRGATWRLRYVSG